jgi:hypothetical protein
LRVNTQACKLNIINVIINIDGHEIPCIAEGEKVHKELSKTVNEEVDDLPSVNLEEPTIGIPEKIKGRPPKKVKVFHHARLEKFAFLFIPYCLYFNNFAK